MAHLTASWRARVLRRIGALTAASAPTQIAIRGRVVRPGMRFQHTQWTIGLPDGTVRPDTCTVVAVRGGFLHYRNESGFVARSYPSSFASLITRWLPETA
jgi:hypothetical protein